MFRISASFRSIYTARSIYLICLGVSFNKATKHGATRETLGIVVIILVSLNTSLLVSWFFKERYIIHTFRNPRCTNITKWFFPTWFNDPLKLVQLTQAILLNGWGFTSWYLVCFTIDKDAHVRFWSTLQTFKDDMSAHRNNRSRPENALRIVRVPG